jgi:hypothetical protein
MDDYVRSDAVSDDDVLAAHAAALADALDRAVAGWVVRCVERIVVQWRGDVPDDVRVAAARAGERALADVGPRVRALLARDVDEQRANPLALLRDAVRYPTEVLHGAGVPPVVRDEFAEAQFPDDVYDLTPASFADLDPALHEPGMAWGAAKAFTVLGRRRAEGRR